MATLSDETTAPADQATPAATQDLSSARTAGKVLAIRDGGVVFQPRGTNYELHLDTESAYTGPVGKPVQATVHLKARKVYTVPSGGSFVAPIMGTPRTVQGRVLEVQPGRVVVHAGPVVVIELPEQTHALDLARGPIQPGAMLNAVILPGTSFDVGS